MSNRRIAVIGGGIAGLAAALELHDRLGAAAEIVVIEGSARAGGKLRTGAIDGRRVETGAETFLARAADDPSGAPSAAVLLAQRLGLGDDLRHPATTAAGILTGGALRAMPGGTLMGVPVNGSALDEPWGPATGADADLGRPVLGADADRSVGALVRERVGDAVVDRLVDPLLGGVYAGRADDLSIAVTMPGLAAACREEHTLAGAVRQALSRRSTTPGPAFATVDGGLSRLIEEIVAVLPDGSVRLGLPVREVAQRDRGYALTIGPTRDAQTLDVGAIVLAVPSRPAARLLTAISPVAAEAVGALDYASIGLVTFVLPPGALDGTELDGRSGALVPAVEGHLVKAITVFSTKWAEQPDGAVLLRCSIGRYGDEAALQRTDDELIEMVAADLASIVGRPLPGPLAATVTRWGGALPQYAPGHVDRVSAARSELPPTIALAGAGYDGVGIPVCVTSGQAAAAAIAGEWGE
jgi:oxygen-dependent protoporphyrinogen oxidase